MKYNINITIFFKNLTVKKYEAMTGHFVEGGVFGINDGMNKIMFPIDTIKEIQTFDHTDYSEGVM